MSLNFNSNIFWGKGPSTPNNNNPPATYTTFSGSTTVNPNINASGSSGGGGGGNWGIIGSIGTDVRTIKCGRCGYTETPYEEKYCKLCNEEL